MRTIGNLLWLVLAGFWMAVGSPSPGSCCASGRGDSVRHPVVQAGRLALWPFGRVVVNDPDASAALGCIGNVLWLVLAGWWLALGHLFTGIVLCLTIIGIPLGVANLKLALLALVPFGKTVVSLDRIAGRDVWMRGPRPIG